MNIPEYYQKYFRIYLRYAVIMTIVALLTGILFQESSKKAPFSEVLPGGVHLESVISLALVHGHAFLIGVLIPLAVTWMLYLGLALGFAPISEKSLKIGTWHYLPASVMAVVLMLYKGYYFLLGVRAGNLDFNALNASFFFGSHIARAIVYGLTHTVMAVGLSILVLNFWGSMNKKAPAKA